MSRNGFGTDASVGTAAVVTAASFVAALIAWVTGSPVIDGVFIAIVLAVFALVLRGTVISVRTGDRLVTDLTYEAESFAAGRGDGC